MKKLHYDQGFVLPGGGQIIGAMLIAGALFNLVTHLLDHAALIAITGIPVGMLFFLVQGVEIDLEQKTVFAWYGFPGIKKGKKRPLSDFSNVVLSRQGVSLGSANYRGVRSRERIESFDLLLVNKDQTLQQLIKYCPSQYDAQGEATELAEVLQLEITEYKPSQARQQ